MASDPEAPASSANSLPPRRDSAQRARINRWPTIAIAGVIVGTGTLFFNVMPLILSSLARARPLTDSQIGFFASAVMGGAMVATLASVLWIRRFSWRLTSLVAALAATAALFGLMVLENYFAMLAVAFVLGCGQAAMIAPPIALLSDTDTPTRNFAVMVGLQVGLASVLAAAFPAIDGAWSFAGGMGVMGATTLVCAGLALTLPAHGIRGGGGAPAVARPPSNAPVFLGLGALLVFYTGITAVWGFAGILGDARGLGEGEVASAVSVSLGAGLVGSVVAGVLGDRVRALSAILFGSLGVGATYVLLAFEGGYWFFLATLLAMNAFWNVSVAYQAGLIASFDVTGRFAILMTAGQTAGALLGPGMMGLILDSTDGFRIGLAFAGVWILGAYGLFWKAVQSGALARN